MSNNNNTKDIRSYFVKRAAAKLKKEESTTDDANEKEDTVMTAPPQTKKARTDDTTPASSSFRDPLIFPKDAGCYLRACIKRWGLQPPFTRVKDDGSFWKDYYLDRCWLEFRGEHSFTSEGKELPTSRGDKGEQKTKGILFKKEDIEAFKQIMASELGCASADITIPIPDPPPMKHICEESYAEDGYNSAANTSKGEYLYFTKEIQNAITKTLKGTALPVTIQSNSHNNVYILSYWINWEDMDDARTVEVTTRFYSPIGNGHSLELFWTRHFRRRRSCNGELSSSLHYLQRSTCEPTRPCEPDSSGSKKTMVAKLACVNSFSEDDEDIRKKLNGRSTKKVSQFLFGETTKKASAFLPPRKMLKFLARASGAYHIGGAGNWIYKAINDKHKLSPGEEESDSEETQYLSCWGEGY